jgi:hypothetical protein
VLRFDARSWSAGQDRDRGRVRDRDERPDRPFSGYKLAHAVLSADGAMAGFAGLSLGAGRVYGVSADAACVWNVRHAPPHRRCGCGFYCLHSEADARALSCATANRSALLLEVVASGRYIRYERGIRSSRQRVRAIKDARCGCGRTGTALADSGTGLVGWRHLTPVCVTCAADRPALSLPDFAARLDAPVRVDQVPAATAGPAAPALDESPLAVLTAEIALLHARLDDLQSRLGRG